MELRVVYEGGKRFAAMARNHRIVSDQPAEDGGSDQGMTPPELFLASLGTCIAYYAAEYLRARRLPADGLEVQVSAGKRGKPVRIVDIAVTVSVPGVDTEERHREGLKRAVGHCLIHNTLLEPSHVEITIGAPVAELTV